jgi:hypothetical protein
MTEPMLADPVRIAALGRAEDRQTIPGGSFAATRRAAYPEKA